MNNFYQKGDVITVTLAAAKTAGAIEDVGTIVGVYGESGVTGDKVPLHIDGVFTLTKKSGQALTVGAKTYLSGTGAITTTATGNNSAGIATAVAATGDATCKVRINFGIV